MSTGPRLERHNRFFLAMATVVLVYVAVGFTPSFLLRPVFRSVLQFPNPPWYYYLHGALMLAWLTLLIVQTSLVVSHRVDVHRRLGLYGAALAVAVIGSMILVTLELPHQFVVDPVRQQVLPFQRMVLLVWGNFAEIILFAIFIATAIWMRRRPQAHKRLLLLSVLTMMSPASGRVAGYLGTVGSKLGFPATANALGILAVIVALLLPLTLMAHDLHSARRVHPATAWGVGGLVIFQVLAAVIANTDAGRAVVVALE
jgi:hypothetical protein